MRSLLYQPVARLRKRRRAQPGPPPRIDKKRHWRGSNPLKRSVRVLVYGGGLLLLAALAGAVIAALRHRSYTFDNRCQQRALSCSVLASFLVPLLTLALVSALFLLGRLWYLRRRYLRDARSRPQAVVPTAGSIIGDVVGRDELCRVMIADMRDAQTRRPHVVVGGIGTGKTALLVRMTKLLAHQRAVPVAIRLRDAQNSLDFGEMARVKFTTDLQSSILSDAEGEKVWRQLLKEGRIVVLADGLEEALIKPSAEAERDNLIRLAIRKANEDGLPLIIASRPHNPLRGTEAALVELEPLSEEAALDYIQRKNPVDDEQRIDWIVETADATEAPLYLQIARQLHRAGLLVYVSGNPNDHQLDTRSVDRAQLRLRLLETWKQAIVNGHFPPGVALSREDRVAAIEQLSVLACIGLRHDTLQVELDEFEALLRLSKDKEKKDKPPMPIIAEARRRLRRVGRPFDIRLAATWGTQLQLVEAQENAVRFPHSILQAYLGSRLIGDAMTDGKFRKEALKNSGRELLIALVMQSRAEPKQRSARQPAEPSAAALVPAGPIAAEAHLTARDRPAPGATGTGPASAKTSAPDPPEPIGAERTRPEPAAATSAGPDVSTGVQAGATDLRTPLRHAAGKRTDAKALDLYATALEIDSVNPAPQHQDIATEILANWQKPAERDPRTVQHAQLNLVRRFGEAARAITLRRSGTGSWGSRRTEPGSDTAVPGICPPAYRQLFDIACAEPYYPVRHAAAQEIGAGGDDALAELGPHLRLRLSAGEQARTEGNGQVQAADGQQQHGVTGAEQREQQGQNKDVKEEKAQRENIMRAWLAPLLVGSAATDSSQRTAQDFLKNALDFVHRQNQQPDRERSGLSIEIALAQGFKYAANRRREHPQARSEARAYLTDQAKEMLSACSFWYTRLTLIQALALWRLPDDENRPNQPVPDYKKLVADWSGMDGRRRRDRHHEHPFVVEAARLAVRALETGQPERYMWIDESGVVSRVGSSPAKPHSRRKHNLWIPPSTGWTALNSRAQQLVADVLLLLNLAERCARPTATGGFSIRTRTTSRRAWRRTGPHSTPPGRWARPGTSPPAPDAQPAASSACVPTPRAGSKITGRS